ncbi:hypothetical protein [Euzebya sp.]|uniref:hypothetical protein n=1 Tax=Euzebya sp. TaxID=1971409 RepID=UPI0035158F07
MADTLAWPVRVVDGAFVMVEVGSEEEARQNVAVLAATRQGERIPAPGYGIPDPTGIREFDTAELTSAAARFVPGVPVRVVEDRADDTGTLTITVDVNP